MPRVLIAVGVFLAGLLTLGHADQPFRYIEGKHGPAELRHIQGIPVLTVAGTPEEMAEQMARLTLKSSGRLFNYPKDVLEAFYPEGSVAGIKRETGLSIAWRGLLTVGEGMVQHFPPDHKREFEAMLKVGGVDREALLAANTMFDVKKMINPGKLFFGCSSLAVSAERSTSGKAFMGRNLDFPTMGYLQDYTLVIAYRPTGKHAFVAVGFPGVIGVISGMNDQGLAVAVLEVYASNDGASRFQSGTPYAMSYRRILEECSTIPEAMKLLEGTKRTTMCNLAVCDKNESGFLEITPKSVVYRRSSDGVTSCTNHFNSDRLAVDNQGNIFDTVERYQKLEKAKSLPKLGVADMAAKLHDANLDDATLQTMVFEPSTLKLHLALAPCPSSGNKLKEIDVAKLLTASAGGDKPSGDKSKDDVDKVQGAWSLVSIEAGGKIIDEEMNKGVTFVFEKDTVSLGKDSGRRAEARFSVDAGKKPRWIDMRAENGFVSAGIYLLDGDDLRICQSTDGRDRPSEFVTKADRGHRLIILKRLRK